MLEYDPVSRLCVMARNLYILSALGEYTHPNQRIQKMIRDAIAHCDGSWRDRLKQMLSYLDYGLSFTELAMPVMENGKATLADMRTLDPEKYELWGERGVLTWVRYNSQLGWIDIPYNAGIHIVCGAELNFNSVSGAAMGRAALPYWQLHKVLMPILAIAGQRQATPILVQKTETGAEVLVINSDGTPKLGIDGQPIVVNKGYDVMKKLEAIGSAGVTVIDRDDEIFSIESKIAGDFLLGIVELAKQMRMQAFLLPPTPFGYSASGTGDSGLSDTQMQNFKMITASWAADLGEALIEGFARPLILYNRGDIGQWGEFPVNVENPQSLEIAKTIVDAVQKGAFSRDDIAALNVARAALGIQEWADVEALRESRAETIATETEQPVIPNGITQD